jgi:hypothetical protein
MELFYSELSLLLGSNLRLVQSQLMPLVSNPTRLAVMA